MQGLAAARLARTALGAFLLFTGKHTVIDHWRQCIVLSSVQAPEGGPISVGVLVEAGEEVGMYVVKVR